MYDNIYGIHNGYSFFWMGLGMIIFWGIFLWLIIFLIKVTTRDKECDEDDSMEILNKRYAKGEITKKEYNTIKKALEE